MESMFQVGQRIEVEVAEMLKVDYREKCDESINQKKVEVVYRKGTADI